MHRLLFVTSVLDTAELSISRSDRYFPVKVFVVEPRTVRLLCIAVPHMTSQSSTFQGCTVCNLRPFVTGL